MKPAVFNYITAIFFFTQLLFACSYVKQETGDNEIKRNTDITHLEFTVEEAPEWTALFKRSSGWFGADGIFTIPLKAGGARATETDSTLFIFSDTMIGEIEDGKLKEHTMVNNSVAYLSGNLPDEKNLHFYYDKKNDGKPVSLFFPQTPPAQPKDYYWLGDGFVNHALGGNTYIFAYRMRNMDESDWSFTQVGNVLITIPAGSRPPFKDQRQAETPFLYQGSEESENGSLGAGIFNNTKEGGVSGGDGYIYVYGIKGKEKHLIVSRVLPENFEQFEKWHFWDGADWVADMHKAAFVTSGVSNELSVSALPDGRFALVFQVDGMSEFIGLKLGLTPYGPFGPTIKMWQCTETKQKNYITYNAKAHPYLSPPGELLISYNVNAFDFFNEIKVNPNLYRPRFIRVKFK